MKLILIPLLIFATAHAKTQNWKAEKSIELSHSQIALDGGKPSSLKCPHQIKSAYGKLEIQSTSLELLCYDDYMGGFFHKDQLLAQEDGDAGDLWETQALLFFDKESKSLILSLKYYSTYDTSIECHGLTKEELEKSGWSEKRIKDCLARLIECKTNENFKKWDSTSQKFIDTKFKGNTPKRQFKAFEHYLKNCK